MRTILLGVCCLLTIGAIAQAQDAPFDIQATARANALQVKDKSFDPPGDPGCQVLTPQPVKCNFGSERNSLVYLVKGAIVQEKRDDVPHLRTRYFVDFWQVNVTWGGDHDVTFAFQNNDDVTFIILTTNLIRDQCLYGGRARHEEGVGRDDVFDLIVKMKVIVNPLTNPPRHPC